MFNPRERSFPLYWWKRDLEGPEGVYGHLPSSVFDAVKVNVPILMSC